MGTNFFFNNFTSSAEQNLITDLVLESIKIYGIDVYYIPKRLGLKDSIYLEDSTVSYTNFYMIDMYIKNVEGFEGEGDFLSKFNIEIRDQITFTVSKRNFDLEIGRFESGIFRPQEGDLIFFPLNEKVFQIKFVEHESVFYQMGSIQMYDLKCELFEYSSEYIKTGISLVDRLYSNYSSVINSHGLLTEDGFEITDQNGYTIYLESFNIKDQDPFSDNEFIQSQSNIILDFTEVDPFSEGGRY